MSKSVASPIIIPTHAGEFVKACLAATKSILACEAMGLAVGLWEDNILAALRIATIAGLGVVGFVLLADTILGVVIELAERLSDRDIDGDGNIGEFRDRVVLVNRPVRDDKQRWVDFVTQAGIDSTVPTMLNAGYTRSEVENGREKLILVGLARWKGDGPTTGWELTQSVADCLNALPSYPLDDDDERTV